MKIILEVIQLLISFFIAIAVHEIGHMIVGILSGFRFELLILGPFGFKHNKDDKIIFYIEKNKAFWGGCSATVPKNNKNNYKKFANIIVGGPIASLIFGLIMFICFYFTDNSFLLMLSVMSICISISTLIPLNYRFGGFYSDGKRYLRMKSNGSDAKVEIAIFNIMQSYYINKNYSKLNIEDAQLLIEDDDFVNQYLGHNFAYCYYKEIKDKKNSDIKLKSMKELEKYLPHSFIKLISSSH